jgi:hypothetical protein
VGVQRPGATLGAKSPDISKKLVLGEDAMRFGRECAEEGELLVGSWVRVALGRPDESALERDSFQDRFGRSWVRWGGLYCHCIATELRI